jgi:transcriptional regulator with XRE-family HTH domain
MYNILMNKIRKKKKGPSKGYRNSETNPFHFGKVLSMQRRKKGLTQTDLGERIGLSKRAISYYEREAKNPSLEIINKISKALNLSPKIFIDQTASSSDKIYDDTISWGLKKSLCKVENLSVKSQKALKDYIDILAKAES